MPYESKRNQSLCSSSKQSEVSSSCYHYVNMIFTFSCLLTSHFFLSPSSSFPVKALVQVAMTLIAQVPMNRRTG